MQSFKPSSDQHTEADVPEEAKHNVPNVHHHGADIHWPTENRLELVYAFQKRVNFLCDYNTNAMIKLLDEYCKHESSVEELRARVHHELFTALTIQAYNPLKQAVQNHVRSVERKGTHAAGAQTQHESEYVDHKPRPDEIHKHVEVAHADASLTHEHHGKDIEEMAKLRREN